MAVQVHRNVNLHRPQDSRHVPVATIPHIFKPVECRNQPRPHGAAIVRPERNCRHLEARTIMALEQFHQKLRRRVLVKIRRQVSQSDFIMIVPALCQRRCLRHHAAHIALRTAPLQRCVIAITQHW